MSEIEDLLPVTIAAERAGVGRNTMLLAAKKGKIKAAFARFKEKNNKFINTTSLMPDSLLIK